MIVPEDQATAPWRSRAHASASASARAFSGMLSRKLCRNAGLPIFAARSRSRERRLDDLRGALALAGGAQGLGVGQADQRLSLLGHPRVLDEAERLLRVDKRLGRPLGPPSHPGAREDGQRHRAQERRHVEQRRRRARLARGGLAVAREQRRPGEVRAREPLHAPVALPARRVDGLLEQHAGLVNLARLEEGVPQVLPRGREHLAQDPSVSPGRRPRSSCSARSTRRVR